MIAGIPELNQRWPFNTNTVSNYHLSLIISEGFDKREGNKKVQYYTSVYTVLLIITQSSP